MRLEFPSGSTEKQTTAPLLTSLIDGPEAPVGMRMSATASTSCEMRTLRFSQVLTKPCGLHNRRFPEITGEDNLTVFSYSGRVNSPEWRWQRRRADLRHFEIFRHGPIIIYTRLPGGGTYYPICTFPASSECLIGISDAFSAFCLRVSVIFPTCSLYPQQKRAYPALHPQTWTELYRSLPDGSYRVQFPGFPKIVYYDHKCSRFSHITNKN